MSFDTQIGAITINDLKDRYFDGFPLSEEEKKALHNFDQYRLEKLNGSKSDQEFKLVYLKIQAMANLSPYKDFLNSDFIISY